MATKRKNSKNKRWGWVLLIAVLLLIPISLNSPYFKSSEPYVNDDYNDNSIESVSETTLLTMDITGDLETEIISAVLIEDTNKLQILNEYGYERAFSSLTIISAGSNSPITILTINEEGIFNQLGRKILDQEPALFGYGLNLIEHVIPDSGTNTVLLEITILDETGSPISDDLTVYWHPESSDFRATNTFGAPGTY